MPDKPGWYLWYKAWYTLEEIEELIKKERKKKSIEIDIWNSKPSNGNKKIWWSVWHTLDEVEELLKKEKQKKN